VTVQIDALSPPQDTSHTCARPVRGATLPGRRRWEPPTENSDAAPLVRPGPRVAYTEDAAPETWSPLAERVVEAMWTRS